MRKKLATALLTATVGLSSLIAAPAAQAQVTSTQGARIVRTAEAYRGVPYVWGGSSPRGFDCSGLTWYTFRRLGRWIPRTAEGQWTASRHTRTPVEGDLVFVHSGSYVFHVAIYVNSRTWLEAERPGRGVNLYRPWSRSVWYGYFTLPR
ncbi:C40 family peptidase [Streptomyces sp. NPDC093261]|uniref:C40 family peptidase n=1 Tax=Streptomyces sp. NPDC093261 TaxID=3366037 RepID=UPI00380BEBA7